MRTNVQSTFFAALIASGALFGAPGVQAVSAIPGVCSDTPTGLLPSCTCKSPSGFTISLQTEIPSPTQTIYRYAVSGAGNAKVNAIRETQVVVPRPVLTSNQNPNEGKGVILGNSVTAINDFCVADPNSGNNKGNCQGFLVHAQVLSPTNTSGTIDIPVGRNVADGMVTFNIIGGNGNTELCSAVNNVGAVITPQSGIAGPGDIGDPFQPKFALQDATVANGKCIAHLVFDKKGFIIDVTADNAPGYVPGAGETNCTAVSVTGDIIVNNAPLKNNTPGSFFHYLVFTVNGNQITPSLIKVPEINNCTQ